MVKIVLTFAAFAIVAISNCHGKSFSEVGPKENPSLVPIRKHMHSSDSSIETPKFEPKNNLELKNQFWINNGKQFVDRQLRKQPNRNRAKNIIFFLGDGMSMQTLAALRPYMGGEEKQYSFEDFPYVGMAKTYCVDQQVADSACTATGLLNRYSLCCRCCRFVRFTVIEDNRANMKYLYFIAYLSGVKGNMGTIGLNAKVPKYSCTGALDNTTHTTSIAKWAMDAGKWAGFVTTTKVTDASPSGLSLLIMIIIYPYFYIYLS